MKKINFKVKFLSDIVLQATSNNEGKIENLDFIPGSNFLGIVAKNYDDFKNPFDIFHSGKVRFGDARIIRDNKLTYKMPLSFFHEKLNKDIIYNHHLIKDFSKFKQLKQKRDGYITKDLEEINIEYRYSQKSAYDTKKRKSKDSQMYGYKAIKKGSVWQFSISYDESIDITQLKTYILGKHRLGKSRSSEYGLIEIFEEGNDEEITVVNNSKYDYLYCQSRLALFDENNNPTFDVKYICNDLNVVYEKTQIKTSTFTPYNRARQTKDYERVVINSGSVIVVEKLTPFQKEIIQKRVGGYLNEGFGEIIINPSFLFENEFSFKKYNDKRELKNISTSTKTINFLLNRKNQEIEMVKMLEDVEVVVSNMKNLYKDISKSQWGAIRSILNSNDSNYEDTIIDYISNGVKKWNDTQIEKFKEHLKNKKEFVLLSVIRLQKEAK